ncbi:MAG: prevent-host-death protein [Bacteroides sp.]|nr:prevent-host-death protein [Bacteroides sp.]
MEIVSARDFRANQIRILTKALKGESVLLSSRIGMFKITPVTEEDTLTTRICKGLEQVKMIEEGKLPRRTIQDMLDDI